MTYGQAKRTRYLGFGEGEQDKEEGDHVDPSQDVEGAEGLYPGGQEDGC